jgi:2-polyprenyl-3-methyl-5-hydroxy-6-metoxy-1,4-benzoquinol methylase
MARQLNRGLRTRILDVGSGSGELLLFLRKKGFHHLMGIDAFIGRELIYDNGVRVIHGSIDSPDQPLI